MDVCNNIYKLTNIFSKNLFFETYNNKYFITDKLYKERSVKMQVQRIQNYNYNPQFKGYIKLISPTGTSVTVKPERIEALCAQNMSLFCRRNGNPYDGNLLKHVIATTKVLFSSKMPRTNVVVNATDSAVFNAMNEAKKIPDDKIIEVGKPLPYLKAIYDGKEYNQLPTYDIKQLKQQSNTVAVYSRGNIGDYEDVEFNIKYLHDFANTDSYIRMMSKIIKDINK